MVKTANIIRSRRRQNWSLESNRVDGKHMHPGIITVCLLKKEEKDSNPLLNMYGTVSEIGTKPVEML